MHRDFEPYYVRVGDSWSKIDYELPASAWMKPLVCGEETDLIEIPASWELDDLPPMMFIKANPNSHGFVNPRDLEQQWKDQFDWVYREYDHAVFPITVHPDVSGRPQTLLMHERLIESINRHEGVRWVTFDQIADDFARRNPRSVLGERYGYHQPGTGAGPDHERPDPPRATTVPAGTDHRGAHPLFSSERLWSRRMRLALALGVCVRS